MSGRPCFLDTTVFADRAFGRSITRKAIDALISKRDCLTSEYVRQQFRATFLRAAVLVYNRLVETRSMEEVLRETDEYRFFSRGDGVKARKVFTRLLESKGTVDDNLATLELWINRDIEVVFHSLVKTVVNETGCCLCDSGPSRDANGVYFLGRSCRKSPAPECHIQEFWRRRSEYLEAIVKYTGIVPKGSNFPAAREAAVEVLANQAATGIQCSVALSDAVIACESPPDSDVMTSNIKDFEPLAEATNQGRRAVNYPNAPSRPV